MRRLLATAICVVSLAGCTQPSDSKIDSAAEAATPASFNLAGAPTVELSVPDMMCEQSCAVATKKILAAQPGAKEVLVDYPAKTARIAIDQEQFDADAAVAALVDHGFDNSRLQSAAE